MHLSWPQYGAFSGDHQMTGSGISSEGVDAGPSLDFKKKRVYGGKRGRICASL